MLAVYASHPSFDDPLSALAVGERPEPVIPDGWVRVKVSHASLNRHDLFTLRGISGHEAHPIPFPMILGNDGAGTLDDGTEVVIYPVLNSPGWRGDDMLDPSWHIFSERVPGTFADFVAVPQRNAIPRPEGLSALDASVMGTAWLTAYRMLFTQACLRPGETMLVQGASGGVSTALIQLGRAAGIEVWVTSRNRQGRELAERLGAHRSFDAGAKLPRRVDAVMDSVGQATWAHTLQSARRGGTVITVGVTTGHEPTLDLVRVFMEQLTVQGSVMGTLEEMNQLLQFVRNAGIKPEIGHVLPMERAEEALRAMWEGRTHGKTVLTR
ncbi:zinc-binding dehydrogenase [Stigmatella aurantiaca]|uniref:Alcohol dehydrogenase n=1 Tax=Stigmatella aurantiaca (strain DW4/3-1) TaxID=378806 RepID=Q08UY2_STIAD|nr:zinc-binding dehydrogenase [Stigmatella aurantiaca]ADO68817.1 Alcohol dehydrogenase [Stigmatella aurantiaca DW4/3-1]EAU64278.1 alcohol dehydrogenase [Stigmatella aurantiaca DW4/3-1]